MRSMKNRKLHGSVLLTVVAVMSLLIIFLFGTLALATATNNRAHVNYSQAQTGITARTIVDTAFKTLGESKDFASAFNKLDASSGVMDIPVSLSGNASTGFGHVNSLTAEYAGDKMYYNYQDKKWNKYNVVKLTANVTMGGVTSQATAYVVKDPPNPGGGKGGGAGFVTTGGASLLCQSDLFGGSYLGIPTKDEAKGYDYSYGSGNYLSGATFNFRNKGSTAEADVVINGNFGLGKRKNMLTKLRFPSEGKGITVWGDMEFSDDIYDDLRYSSNISKDAKIAFNKVPYLYVDGEARGCLKIGPNKDSGDDEFPFNAFIGNINAEGNKASFGGNIYLMNPDKTNTINVTESVTLYKWTSNVINRVNSEETAGDSVSQGNIYSKGNFELKNGNSTFTVEGNLCIEKDLSIMAGKLVVNGDLVVGGRLLANSDLTVEGNIYAGSVAGNKISGSGSSIGTKKLLKGKNATIYQNPWYSATNQYVLVDPDQIDMSKYSKESIPGTAYECIDFKGKVLNDPNDKENQIPYWKLYGDEGSWKNESDEVEIYTGGSLNGKTIQPISNWGKDIYPAYAERDVIIGINEEKYKNPSYDPDYKEGDPIENKGEYLDTQVVKTMSQLLDSVVNPYDNVNLPTTILSHMDAATKNVYDDQDDITATDIIKVGGISGVATKVITEDCTLDGISFSADKNPDGAMPAGTHSGKSKAIIFKPGTKDMLVIIKNIVDIPSGYNFVIDDSEFGSGNVYFYIDKNSKLILNGGSVTTVNYMKYIKSLSKNGTNTNPMKINTIDQNATNPISAPNVYFYAAKDEELEKMEPFKDPDADDLEINENAWNLRIENTEYLAANIVSPHIRFAASGTGENAAKNIDLKYNGSPVNTSYNTIFGCCNAKTTYFKNQFNVIYIPRGDGQQQVVNNDLNNWYKLLYYDEY